MSNPQIFVSCGQRTPEEKQLAKELCDTIRQHGTFDVYFAEFQHNLHGLQENILDALERTTGFVTVMHKRGEVTAGHSTHVRASVWVEQEIAIAAYIARTSKRTLLTAAYIEKGVGREGIRDLLHLNPTPFTDNAEVIADLKAKLNEWGGSGDLQSPSEDRHGKLELQRTTTHDVHAGRLIELAPILTNKGSRVNEYSCSLEVPRELLTWNNTTYFMEDKQQGAARTGYRRFLITEASRSKEPLLMGQPLRTFNLHVSISDLVGHTRAEALQKSIYVVGELGEHAYSLTVPCAEVFALPDKE